MADPPLPPRRPDMNLATTAMFNAVGPDSFREVPGFGGIEIRDLGLGANSQGRLAGQVFRASASRAPLPGTWHMHDLDFQIGYIARGWGLYEFEGVGQVRLQAGTSIQHLPRNRLRMLECSPDFEGVWIKSSTRDKITSWRLNPKTGEYEEITVVAELG